jgi:hypothetical protein
VLANGLLRFGWWVVSWRCSVVVAAKFGGCGQAESIVAKKHLRRRLYFGCLEFCTVHAVGVLWRRSIRGISGEVSGSVSEVCRRSKLESNF